MGSGTNSHSNLRSVTVIDYAGGFTSNGKCPLSKVKEGTSTTGTTTSDTTNTSGGGSTDNQSSTGS